MIPYTNFKQALLIILAVLTAPILSAQSTIPEDYRGASTNIARGILDGNMIETNFRNHGEMARWNDLPWGEWNRVTHIDGIGFMVSGQVTGERSKWSQFYGEGVQDTLLNPVILNYRQAGRRISPYDGTTWGWLPLPGFHNPKRNDPISGQLYPNPAFSNDNTSWPDQWPDKLTDESDPGWSGHWNGILGKGNRIEGQEIFYVIDDASDREYQIRTDGNGNTDANSEYGIYYPSASDSTLGGMGLQVEVRHLAWEHAEAEDILISHYRITNVGDKPLEKLWSSLIIDFGLSYNANLAYDSTYSMIYGWNSNQGRLGHVGFVVLEGELGGFDLSTRPYYESGNNLRDDTWLFKRIQENHFSHPDFEQPATLENIDPFALMTSAEFKLEPNTSSNFITAMVFGEDKEDLFKNVEYARNDLYATGFQPIITSTEESVSEAVSGFELSQNYPNPFNPSTQISYALPQAGDVRIDITNTLGQRVATLVQERKSAGRYSVTFDAGGLSSGIYFYTIRSGDFMQTKKMLLIK
jgi:hypothetical protein